LRLAIANIVLDFLFVACLIWGLKGAIFITFISQCLGGLLPLIYFSFLNDSFLKFCITSFDWKVLFKIVGNGSS